MKENIIIIGGVHHNTLGVIRSLGEEKVDKKNIELLLVEKKAKQRDFISHSRYILKENTYYLEDYNELLPFLLELSKDEKKRVIICCSDGAAEVVIKYLDNLKTAYAAPSLLNHSNEIFDKQIQTSIAQSMGMAVPKSSIIRTNNQLEIETWTYYPCITKPIVSAHSGGKTDIRVSSNLAELKKNLKETKSDYVQIQEYISKSMEYQLIGLSVDNGNTVVIPGFTTIIRQPENTNTGYLKYSPLNELNFDIAPPQTFLKNIGYNGLFSMEFIRDKYGKDYYLETNFRNDGNAYCVKTAGINLPYMWIMYCLYNRIPEELNRSFNTDIYFMPEFSDIIRGIKSVGLIEWIKEFLFAKSHAIYNQRDIKPFIYQFYFLLCKQIKRLFEIS